MSRNRFLLTVLAMAAIVLTVFQNCSNVNFSSKDDFVQQTSVFVTPKIGTCGSANGASVFVAPTANLCNSGTASSVTGSGPFNWTCAGSDGGTTASCSAPLAPPIVNGICGSANGVGAPQAPSANLCNQGTPSSVTGSSPFNWSCAGSNGGSTASCSAPFTPPTFQKAATFLCGNLGNPFPGLTPPQQYSVLNAALITTGGGVVCNDTTNFYPALQSTRTFTWAPPAACVATPGTYYLVLYDPALGGPPQPYGGAWPGYAPPFGHATATVNVNADKTITWAGNSWSAGNYFSPLRGATAPDAIWVNSLAPVCDITSASPLMVKMTNDRVRSIPLSSQKNGILFDILGENSHPTPHSKKLISWTTNGDYRFIVKPDANGNVNGIDEMFGNNTKGPDGKFANNGYKALAKFDVNFDGFITKDDPVFSELRLWADLNGDGKAQADELMKLDDPVADIKAIDLHYDRRYFEQDQYGNQTRMKSVVIRNDGSFRLVFDLWFRYLEP